MPSVFTKIIKNEIPSLKIHEDEFTISIFPLHCIQMGHVLVIPKCEVDHFTDVPEPHYSQVFKNAKVIAKAILKATGCPRVGTLIQGWEVPHFHYHLVPMWKPSDLDFKWAKERNPQELKVLQAKIISALEF